jgi:hypothetical protein
MEVLRAFLNTFSFKGFNSATNQVFLVVVHSTVIRLQANTEVKHVNWPLDAIVKISFKNYVQGEQVACRAG